MDQPFRLTRLVLTVAQGHHVFVGDRLFVQFVNFYHKGLTLIMHRPAELAVVGALWDQPVSLPSQRDNPEGRITCYRIERGGSVTNQARVRFQFPASLKILRQAQVAMTRFGPIQLHKGTQHLRELEGPTECDECHTRGGVHRVLGFDRVVCGECVDG